MIKRIIAKEGLIFIGLAVVLYIILFFIQDIPVVYQKYRLEFANGEAHIISINPEIRNDANYKRLLKEAHNPSQKLIDKRIKEFIRTENIKSNLKEAKLINGNQVHISRLYSLLLSVPFILKVVFVYFVLLLLRFILWATKTLKEK